MDEEIIRVNESENIETKKGEIVIYKAKSGAVRLDVRLEKETVWLSQAQIARLFGTQRPAITKHLSNIFKSKELDKESVCSILEHTARDGNKRIASIMFIYYLEKNTCLYKTNGERKINDNAMVALALLIASSNPREKGVMVKIITNLLNRGGKHKTLKIKKGGCCAGRYYE